MGAELARKRQGKGTQTGMSEKQLRDFASKPKLGTGKTTHQKAVKGNHERVSSLRKSK
jgi:hypothetical protein